MSGDNSQLRLLVNTKLGTSEARLGMNGVKLRLDAESDDYSQDAAHHRSAEWRLTTQEVQCLRWCKEGKTNWEIGEILDISARTVEFHLGNAMRKLGAPNRITAVVMGIKRGIIPL